jgi:hypothetical protein
VRAGSVWVAVSSLPRRTLRQEFVARLIQLLNSKLRFSNLAFRASSFHLPGGHAAGVTPVPIPNTVVKPRRADDTALVTVWERRSLPGLKSKDGPVITHRAVFLCADPLSSRAIACHPEPSPVILSEAKQSISLFTKALDPKSLSGPWDLDS